MLGIHESVDFFPSIGQFIVSGRELVGQVFVVFLQGVNDFVLSMGEALRILLLGVPYLLLLLQVLLQLDDFVVSQLPLFIQLLLRLIEIVLQIIQLLFLVVVLLYERRLVDDELLQESVQVRSGFTLMFALHLFVYLLSELGKNVPENWVFDVFMGLQVLFLGNQSGLEGGGWRLLW